MLGDKVRGAFRATNRPLSTRQQAPPQPPFQKTAIDVIWTGFRIDADAVTPFLPDGLVPSPTSIGILGIYTAPSGSGIAPYRRGVVGVSAQGVPGSDIGEGMFVMGDIVDMPGCEVMRDLYSDSVVEGTALTWPEADLLHGVASVDGVDWLRATIRPSRQVRRDLTGVDTFLGHTRAGLIKYADSTLADLDDAEVMSLEITDDAPDYMQALRPLEYVFGLHAPRVNSIWSEPRVVGPGASKNAASVFLSLIDDTGRAAAIVREDGTLLEANTRALALLKLDGSGVGERLLSNVPAERQALARALRMSVGRTGPRLSDPVLMQLPGGGYVLAYVLPLEHGAHARDSALVLLADMHGPERRDAAQLLQLFGLTAAEARLAALVGTGMPPKAAAGELGISEHTARSTLKTVYDKLEIKKQSELGHLVARLQYS
ncbi:MAG: helix-turn-helix transcriptional regulator [Devosia sp.]|uniref:helix-turn-helix transcriptional regulator n=1 Tax=Devosia sp. TaxID=1871048 RepID=UPI001AC2C295|nr:helix-turn-helix transcriptional regulator [Devosia sp.]MBN9316464.1 helix-turn-helix transcriptional regulator [Devosia sp.]